MRVRLKRIVCRQWQLTEPKSRAVNGRHAKCLAFSGPLLSPKLDAGPNQRLDLFRYVNFYIQYMN